MLFSAEKIIYVTKSAADYILYILGILHRLHNNKNWTNIELQYAYIIFSSNSCKEIMTICRMQNRITYCIVRIYSNFNE